MKKALLVGINYVGTADELRGCINDVKHVKSVITAKFNFDEVKTLLEKEATTAGILAGLKWLVEGAVPGDVLLFHYSGHGSQIRSAIEPDGLDEIICPIDLNWKDKVIRDDHFKAIFDTVPNGVNITVVLDCCHSGSGLDQTNTLFKDAGVKLAQEAPMVPKEGSRFMPMPPKVEKYIKKEKLQIREFKTSRDVNRSALLIAGCLPNQTSADADIDNIPQGAATYAMLRALSEGKQTYREIATSMSVFMEKNLFEQRPQLDGHPSLYDQYFLEPWGTAEGQVEATPPPGTWVEPTPTPAVEPTPTPVPLPTGVDIGFGMDVEPHPTLKTIALVIAASVVAAMVVALVF